MIRRKNPLPSDINTMERTIRLARFPTTSTFEEIEEFISKYGKRIFFCLLFSKLY